MQQASQTNIGPGRAESRDHCVLQVLPALQTGGVERGTVQIRTLTVLARFLIRSGNMKNVALQRPGRWPVTQFVWIGSIAAM